MLIFFFMFCVSLLGIAKAHDVYHFSTTVQHQRFKRMIGVFRCMVCENTSIADSQADFALSLREQVARMVRAGRSDQQIQRYMQERYGDFILFKPPLERRTGLLWMAPMLMLLLGVVLLVLLLRRYRGVR